MNNEKTFLNDENFGKLNITTVVEFYNYPRLFFAENSETNQKYIVVETNEINENKSEFLLAPISENVYRDVYTYSEIDFKTAFLRAENKTTFLITIENASCKEIKTISCSDLTDDLLPESGERY